MALIRCMLEPFLRLQQACEGEYNIKDKKAENHFKSKSWRYVTELKVEKYNNKIYVHYTNFRISQIYIS